VGVTRPRRDFIFARSNAAVNPEFMRRTGNNLISGNSLSSMNPTTSNPPFGESPLRRAPCPGVYCF
jgi:hypothetical protein